MERNSAIGGLNALVSAIERVESEAQAAVNTIPSASFSVFRLESSVPAQDSIPRPATPPTNTSSGRPRGRGHGRGGKSSTAANSKTPKDAAPVDPPDDDIFTSARWTPDEQNGLFTHIFGSDSDDIHQKWLKNKDRVYRKYLEANPSIGARFTVSSVGSKVTSSVSIYGYLREYEDFTGGGGDADLQATVPESDEWHKQRIKYREWKDRGWYNMFDERSSKVDRPVVRNSVAPISPHTNNNFDVDNIHWPATPGRNTSAFEIPTDSDDDKIAAPKTPALPASQSRPVPASQSVSEPRYQAPVKSAKKKSSIASIDTFGALNTYFESKVKLTEEQLLTSKAERATSARSQRLQELRNMLDSNIDDVTRQIVNEKIRQIINDEF
ncbi:hypothetical protein BDP27DRAFT_1419141 [Rhodocollybia butyracea]|uniref:Uncharacterized protein n=1 Tax=Rhodocollybia butyracea TaxID=206335 RepID=A0A9P5PYC3_9AGAR|nr:hypothetical protein BDP27DRAFT_1419141 [Rhodocollybia butyracea]